MSTEHPDGLTPELVSPAGASKPEESAAESKPKPKPRGRPRKKVQQKETPAGNDLFFAEAVQTGQASADLIPVRDAIDTEFVPVLPAETCGDTDPPTTAESKLQDAGLPEASTGNAPPFWYMLTNRINLLTIMGSGVVTTASDAWRYVEDSRQIWNGLIPVWSGGVPPEILRFTQGKGVSAPVLLEFTAGMEILLPPEERGIRLFSLPMPFSKVHKVYFKDQDSLADFKLKQFDDLPVLPVSLLQYGFPEMNAAELPLPAAVTGPEFAFSAFDRQLGALLSATDAFAGRAVAQELYCKLLNFLLEKLPQTASPKIHSAFSTCSNLLVSDSVSDRWLLNNTLIYLDTVGYDAGFNQYDFLDTLEAAAKNAVSEVQGISSGDEKEISDWCGHCRQLLDGTREIWALTDTPHTFVKRGVLLFMLRPEQERFSKVMVSSIKPGPRVYLIAAFLLGYMTGVTRFESAIKKNGQNYFSLIEHFLNIATSRTGSEIAAVSVRTEKPASDVLRILITQRNFQIGCWDVLLSPALFRTYNIAREAGLHPTIDFYLNRLTVTAAPERHHIQIRAAGSGQSDDRIRIYFDLKSSDVKRNTDSASVLKSMMSFNGADSTYGKFATSEDGGGFLYAVDCSLTSLTIQEIRLLVSHVAHVAATSAQNILQSK